MVDDHPLVAEAVAAWLRDLPARVEVAHSIPEALAALGVRRFDLAVLDVSFAGSEQSGLDLLAHCRQGHPAMPVVVVSMFADAGIVRCAKARGAAGFVPKSAPSTCIRDAALAVLAGGQWFPASEEATNRILSPRQVEVVRFLAAGLSERQVAARLHLTVRTIEFHIQRAKKQWGVRSVPELIARAVQEGITLLPTTG